MIFKYKELKKRKEIGEKLIWEEITEKQLRFLYVDEGVSSFSISLLYDVKQSQVDYKRKKFNIKFREIVAKNLVENTPPSLNLESKQRIINEFNIDKISKMMTHFAFRNGPVEDMHSAGKLSDNDMMILNKYMVNRVAGLLKLIKEAQWFKIEAILEMYKLYGTHWDKAEPDIGEVDNILKLWLK